MGGVSGGGGGCESDLTSTPVEMCRWGGPVGLTQQAPEIFFSNFFVKIGYATHIGP